MAFISEPELGLRGFFPASKTLQSEHSPSPRLTGQAADRNSSPASDSAWLVFLFFPVRRSDSVLSHAALGDVMMSERFLTRGQRLSDDHDGGGVCLQMRRE